MKDLNIGIYNAALKIIEAGALDGCEKDIDWEAMSEKKIFTPAAMREYIPYIAWEIYLPRDYAAVPDSLMKDIYNLVDWTKLSSRVLSEDFITKFASRLDWKRVIAYNPRLSDSCVLTNHEYLGEDTFLRTISEKWLRKHIEEFEPDVLIFNRPEVVSPRYLRRHKERVNFNAAANRLPLELMQPYFKMVDPDHWIHYHMIREEEQHISLIYIRPQGIETFLEVEFKEGLTKAVPKAYVYEKKPHIHMKKLVPIVVGTNKDRLIGIHVCRFCGKIRGYEVINDTDL